MLLSYPPQMLFSNPPRGGYHPDFRGHSFVVHNPFFLTKFLQNFFFFVAIFKQKIFVWKFFIAKNIILKIFSAFSLKSKILPFYGKNFLSLILTLLIVYHTQKIPLSLVLRNMKWESIYCILRAISAIRSCWSYCFGA